jgi:hypothetical protein
VSVKICKFLHKKTKVVDNFFTGKFYPFFERMVICNCVCKGLEMEMNNIEKARANREFESFTKKLGIDKTKPLHEQLTKAAHAGRLKPKCCIGKCKGHPAA